MGGIIGGIFGGFAPFRPMKAAATEAPPVAAAGTSDQSASDQRSTLPVAIVARQPAMLTPVPHDLFLNQFTTPSTAAVASNAVALAAPVVHQSLTEIRAHAIYSSVAAEGSDD